MTADLDRLRDAPVVGRGEPQGPLDYYVVLAEAGGPAGRVDGIVVEEFVFAADWTAAGLDGAGWSPGHGGWWSSAEFIRGMRTDPRLRARIRAVGRGEAEDVYRRLGGGELPDEAALRSRFHDRLPLDASAPLVFGPPEVPDGFHERRVYRVLFAGELDAARLGGLRAVWPMTLAEDFADPRARVAGTAHRRTARDRFTWELRRIGPGTAWGLDLTACLGGPSDQAVGPLLRELTTVLRHAGLIPVTVERFA